LRQRASVRACADADARTHQRNDPQADEPAPQPSEEQKVTSTINWTQSDKPSRKRIGNSRSVLEANEYRSERVDTEAMLRYSVMRARRPTRNKILNLKATRATTGAITSCMVARKSQFSRGLRSPLDDSLDSSARKLTLIKQSAFPRPNVRQCMQHA
jgi:hypothetical protein